MHVLSTPPAFILSQDQTLMFYILQLSLRDSRKYNCLQLLPKECLIPFKITLGYFSVYYCLNFCSYELSFQTLLITEFQGFAYVLLKNLHACILFSYQCSSPSLISCSRQLLYIIICCFLCQQLFQLFFNSFSLFQRRPLKLAVFQLFVVAVFSNLG